MQDTMPKALDSDTESEIPASVQSNNNSEPNTDNDEKPEVDALCARIGKIEPGTTLPLPASNGNLSDTDSSVSMASSARLNGNLSDGGPSLPAPPALPKVNSSPSIKDTTSAVRVSAVVPLTGSTSTSVGSAAATANDRIKKYRHQHFSKNIYIGTKNAEKWDTLRNLLQFKNDVEFVSFLLRLAEVDEQRKRKARTVNG